MCPTREKMKIKSVESQQLMGEGKRLEMSRQGERWHPHWGLCIRHLIILLYKPGGAIINADELSCLQITDSGVPLTLGITSLLEDLKKKKQRKPSSLC